MQTQVNYGSQGGSFSMRFARVKYRFNTETLTVTRYKRLCDDKQKQKEKEHQ